MRLDICVETIDGKLYDIEMQVVNKYELPQRMRFYQSMLDLSYLCEGEHYKNLRDNYIIFICKLDYFKKNLPVYFFEEGTLSNDLTRRIHEMIEISRLQEVAKEFYQLISPYEMDIRDKWKTEGLEEGHEEGRVQGHAKGREESIAEGRVQGRAEGHAKGLEKLRNSAANFKKWGSR